MEDIKQRQIEQLQRDIRILEEILSGKIENYTRHPIPVPQRRFIEVPIRFGEVTRKRWAKGELKGGYFTSVCECTYVRTYQYKIINQRNIESSEAAYLGGE